MPISLRICEIYETIMGESSASGWPCILIRMGGCNLNCSYCDTLYAFTEHKEFLLDEIIEKVRDAYPRRVLITGGEPLIQEGTSVLVKYLLEEGYKLYLETNGSLDITSIDSRVVRIMDLKCPASGQSHKNHYQNLEHMTPQDEVKFVICNIEDFLWAKDIIEIHRIQDNMTCLFSPVEKFLEPKILAEWILREKLEARFQLQLHKALWGEKRGI